MCGATRYIRKMSLMLVLMRTDSAFLGAFSGPGLAYRAESRLGSLGYPRHYGKRLSALMIGDGVSLSLEAPGFAD